MSSGAPSKATYVGSSIARVSRVIEGTGTAEGVDATEGACATGAAGGARARGAGTTSKLGGGGQTSPGIQGNPYSKVKTPRIWPIIFFFFLESPKFTCKNRQK